MEKLKKLIEQHSRWQPLVEYVQRIEAYLKTDFTISIENSKSLLESIAKEICSNQGQTYESDDSVSKLLRLAFASIGIQSSESVTQIGSALATIGQNIGEIRNDVGPISHGRRMDELENNKEHFDELTREFLINSVETVACFLIQLFEWKYPLRESIEEKEEIVYENCDDFNNYLDETFGEFTILEYSYTASEILYNVDRQAYKTSFLEFNNLAENENEQTD